MCDQCEILNINGMNCHESGCPNSKPKVKAECFECGFEYINGSCNCLQDLNNESEVYDL